MTKLQYMTEQAREHICKADGASFDLWEEVVGPLDEAIEKADKKTYAEAFADIGEIRETVVRIARELDVDSGLSKAARKDDLDQLYKEAKHGML